ncbi:MAG: ThuA domain-containing protein, partial [Planctomycetes bacterium]|nr:ThuA domain-containing protein [Planctomycetota bacterium]
MRNSFILAAALMSVWSACLATAATARGEEGGRKKVVFIAGRQSHGYGAHEHYAGCMLLAKSLQENAGFKCVVVKDGYPKDTSVFDNADAVVVYSDGGGGHPLINHLDEIDALVEKGVGIACLHYAVEVPKGDPGNHFLKWIGGYFETDWSVNPHWVANFEELPKHPITRGVKPFAINDEWYYHMRFRKNMEGVTPILVDLPGEETLRRSDGPHSGNPDVRAAVLERHEPQVLAWASERPGGHRGFGFTGGHFHWNWGDTNFRRIVLNAIVWTTGAEVPESGVVDQDPTLEQLEENQDYDQPANFDRDGIRRQYRLKSAG